MQIVIDIPEEDYEYLKKHNKHGLYSSILNGITLPKEHGNLVDYEELKNNAREYGAYTEATLSHIKPKIIIEADTKSEDQEL